MLCLKHCYDHCNMKLTKWILVLMKIMYSNPKLLKLDNCTTTTKIFRHLSESSHDFQPLSTISAQKISSEGFIYILSFSVGALGMFQLFSDKSEMGRYDPGDGRKISEVQKNNYPLSQWSMWKLLFSDLFLQNNYWTQENFHLFHYTIPKVPNVSLVVATPPWIYKFKEWLNPSTQWGLRLPNSVLKCEPTILLIHLPLGLVFFY